MTPCLGCPELTNAQAERDELVRENARLRAALHNSDEGHDAAMRGMGFAEAVNGTSKLGMAVAKDMTQ